MRINVTGSAMHCKSIFDALVHILNLAPSIMKSPSIEKPAHDPIPFSPRGEGAGRRMRGMLEARKINYYSCIPPHPALRATFSPRGKGKQATPNFKGDYPAP
jgi:hypothetical protein